MTVLVHVSRQQVRNYHTTAEPRKVKDELGTSLDELDIPLHLSTMKS